jgi:nickel/cobalt exporter
MPDLAQLIQQGTTNLWLFVPMAALLGALHGLEPGHSKTMMAAFIVAIRGTVGQAALLGLAATISHTAVVWIIALGGLCFFGGQLNAAPTEPYFQLTSGVLILGIAVWILYRTRKEQQAYKAAATHTHDETRFIDTGHGVVKLEIFEEGQPPHFRLHGAKGFAAKDVVVETHRADGATRRFFFAAKEHFLESEDAIPEPHEFSATLILSHGEHHHNYEVTFAEHGHHHGAPDLEGLYVTSPGYQDAHERAHANEIRHRFASQHVTTGQIILFGLTGGLVPCSAAITVLLLCVQVKKWHSVRCWSCLSASDWRQPWWYRAPSPRSACGI